MKKTGQREKEIRRSISFSGVSVKVEGLSDVLFHGSRENSADWLSAGKGWPVVLIRFFVWVQRLVG
jgi:hypothetical protein